MQPGTTIQPGPPSAGPPEPRKEEPQPETAPVTVTASLSEEPKASTQNAAAPPTQPAPQWQFTGGAEASQASPGAPPPPPSFKPVAWTASEYVAHTKGASWFMLVIAAVLAVSGIVYLITQELVSTIVLGVIGLAFAFFGARPPQVLEYLVDDTGLHIGSRFYAYGIFRSFSVMQDGGAHSILLMPVQRFGLPITIYYDKEDEEDIVSVLGSNLPHQEREVPAIDRLMSKIHF